MTKTVQTWQIGARQDASFRTYQADVCVIAVGTTDCVYRQGEGRMRRQFRSENEAVFIL